VVKEGGRDDDGWFAWFDRAEVLFSCKNAPEGSKGGDPMQCRRQGQELTLLLCRCSSYYALLIRAEETNDMMIEGPSLDRHRNQLSTTNTSVPLPHASVTQTRSDECAGRANYLDCLRFYQKMRGVVLLRSALAAD